MGKGGAILKKVCQLIPQSVASFGYTILQVIEPLAHRRLDFCPTTDPYLTKVEPENSLCK